jgi:DNA adenine methylase
MRFELTGEDASPFVKWAGGKGQLLRELRARVPGSFGAYHEPFLGGGALFFALVNDGRIAEAHLSDVNEELVETYEAVRSEVEAVIAALGEHRNDAGHYYRVRELEPSTLSRAARAARVIFMNKTGFNGLYRVNSKGKFNVPFGRYANPTICNAAGLRAASRALARATLRCEGFEGVARRAEPGDLVYFDPPYQPLSASSSFTAYSRGGFGDDDQRRLAELFTVLARRGVHVILSNSDTEQLRSLYGKHRVETVQAARAINSRADRRGKINEIIVVAP